MPSPSMLETGQRLTAHRGTTAVKVEVADVLLDLTTQDDLDESGNDRTYVARTTTGQWLLYWDFIDAESRALLFQDKRSLGRYLWSDPGDPGARGLSLQILDLLGLLRFVEE